jgi:hypothetical protein
MSTDGMWTTGQVDWFAAEWKRKQGGRVRLLTPLPRRVRFRLAAWYVIDGVAIWLVEHRCFRAARLVWYSFGGYR